MQAISGERHIMPPLYFPQPQQALEVSVKPNKGKMSIYRAIKCNASLKG